MVWAMGVGGDLLPQRPTRGTFRRQAGLLRRGLARKTFSYKKPGRAQIPPAQSLTHHSLAPDPSLPLSTWEPVAAFTGNTDEKPHPWPGWEWELYQKAPNCQAGAAAYFMQITSALIH